MSKWKQYMLIKSHIYKTIRFTPKLDKFVLNWWIRFSLSIIDNVNSCLFFIILLNWSKKIFNRFFEIIKASLYCSNLKIKCHYNLLTKNAQFISIYFSSLSVAICITPSIFLILSSYFKSLSFNLSKSEVTPKWRLTLCDLFNWLMIWVYFLLVLQYSFWIFSFALHLTSV